MIYGFNKKIKEKAIALIESLIAKISALPDYIKTTLFIFIPIVLYLIRSFKYIINPQLIYEDGVLWLAGAYNFGPRTLLLSYNGIAHTAERLFGLFVALFPLQYAPFIFCSSGFIIFIVFCLYLFSNRLHLFTNNYQRLIVAISIGLCANFNNFFFNFSNSIFLLGFIGLAIYLADDSKNYYIRILEKIVFIIACLTLPFVWFYLIISMVNILLKKRKKYFFLFVILFGSIVQLLVSILMPNYGKFYDHHRLLIPLSTLIKSRYTYIEILNQIITPAFRFSKINLNLSIHLSRLLPICIFSACLMLVLFYVLIKHGKYNLKMTILFMFFFTLASLDSPLLPAKFGPIGILKIMCLSENGSRYYFYAILSLFLMTALLATTYIKKEALNVFVILFFLYALSSSIANNSFIVNKHLINYSQVYNRGIEKLSSSPKGKKVFIPENRKGQIIVLIAK